MSVAPPIVICFGETLIRLSAPQHGRLEAARHLDLVIGGAEANVAVALSRLGSPAGVMTSLADNPLGRAALNALRAQGVDVERIQLRPGRMGLYFVEEGAGLRATEVVYDRAGSAFALTPVEAWDWPRALSGARWLHLSGVTPALGEAPFEAALAGALAAAHAGLQVAFDGNFRASLWGAATASPAERLMPLIAQASLAFVDHRDLALILGRDFDDPDPLTRRRRASEAAFAAFPRLQRIASTVRGEQDELSAVMFARNGEHRAGPWPIGGAIGRIGAGDAFAAGVLHGLITGMGDARALEFGLAAGALKHFLPGDFALIGAEAVERLLNGSNAEVRR